MGNGEKYRGYWLWKFDILAMIFYFMVYDILLGLLPIHRENLLSLHSCKQAVEELYLEIALDCGEKRQCCSLTPNSSVLFFNEYKLNQEDVRSIKKRKMKSWGARSRLAQIYLSGVWGKSKSLGFAHITAASGLPRAPAGECNQHSAECLHGLEIILEWPELRTAFGLSHFLWDSLAGSAMQLIDSELKSTTSFPMGSVTHCLGVETNDGQRRIGCMGWMPLLASCENGCTLPKPIRHQLSPLQEFYSLKDCSEG